MTLEDGTRFLPGQLDTSDNPTLSTILERKFHEVKRIFAVLGCPAEKPRRLSVGLLRLSDLDLRIREFRELSPAEESSLLAFVSAGNAAVLFSFEAHSTVIFGLDGTLADLMRHWKEINRVYLTHSGIGAPENLSQLPGGMGIDGVIDYSQRHLHIPDSKEKMLRDRGEPSMERYAKDTLLKPGVLPFLREFRRRECKLVVATSNVRLMVDAVFKVRGIASYFNAIIVDTDMKEGKLNPEIYLRAAGRLGTEPSRHAIFEDLPEEIQAGQRADTRVYAAGDSLSEPLCMGKMQPAFATIRNYRELWQTKKNTR